MIIFFLVFLVASPLFGLRALRWLALVQQKEYRWDRLKIYLATVQGKSDLWKIWFGLSDFRLPNIKRPVRTPRIGVVAGTYLVQLLTLIFSLLWLGSSFGTPWWWSLSLVMLLYLLIPWMIMVAIIPSWAVSWWVTNQTLKQAQALVNQTKPLIIGITGSYGKSSTKHLVYQVLAAQTDVFVTPKSHNTRYSVAKAIVDGYQGQKMAVIEYAAYTYGEIKELAKWFQPDMAIITGLAPQHLALFGSVEAIVEAKSELVKAVPAANKAQRVYANAEDPGTLRICAAGGVSNPIQFSGPDSVVALQHVGLTEDGFLTFVWRGHTVTTHLVGLQYQSAVQAAIAMGQVFNVPEKKIVSALEAFQPNDNFVQLKKTSAGLRVIDDGGTSNSQGFKAALALARQIALDNQVVVVSAGIVDLGAESASVHADLAAETQQLADAVVYLGQPGLDQFAAAWGSKLITTRQAWQELISRLAPKSVIVLEGRLPAWVSQDLGLTQA